MSPFLCSTVVAVALTVLAHGALAQAAPQPQSLQIDVSYATNPATKKSPVTFSFYAVVTGKNGKPAKKTVYVRVENIVASKPLTAMQVADASKAKAEAIAAAINIKLPPGSMPATVAALPAMPVQIPKPNPDYKPPPLGVPKFPTNWPLQTVNAVTYRVTIPNTFGNINWGRNPTGENGDGVRSVPGGGGGGGGASPSYDGSMGGTGASAAGVDAFGDPSVVEFGTDTYQSYLLPQAGESDATILDDLASDLDTHGVSAEFDLSTDTLALLEPLDAGQELDFGWTDTGLDFRVNFEPIGMPEPSSFALLGPGLAMLVARRRRR